MATLDARSVVGLAGAASRYDTLTHSLSHTHSHTHYLSRTHTCTHTLSLGGGAGGRRVEVNPAPQTLNPNPQALNPNAQTLNLSPQTLNPNPQALNPTSQTLDPNPQSLNPNPQALNPELCTRNGEGDEEELLELSQRNKESLTSSPKYLSIGLVQIE